MMFEKEFEEYKNQPKWKGKIFMKDEETCFKDGVSIKISALEEKLSNADYQLEGRDNEIRELENQQKIDAEHILTLQNEKGELTDKVRELEAQIEEMKCCENCVHHCEMLKTIHDLNERNKILEAQIEKMKSDVVRCFGDEFNILVAKLLKEWEIKENG